MMGFVRAPFSIPGEYRKDLREILLRPTEFGSKILEGKQSLSASDYLCAALVLIIAVWQLTYFSYRTSFQPNYGLYIVVFAYSASHIFVCSILVWVFKGRKSSILNTMRVFSYALGSGLTVALIPVEIVRFFVMLPGLVWKSVCSPRTPECILQYYSVIPLNYLLLVENGYILIIELWLVVCTYRLLYVIQGLRLTRFVIVFVVTASVGSVDSWLFQALFDFLAAQHFI